MSDQFSIGEVAWHVRWGKVTIDSALAREVAYIVRTGKCEAIMAHRVTRHDGFTQEPFHLPWSAEPRELRKLPPPEAGMKWEDLKKSLQPKVRA